MKRFITAISVAAVMALSVVPAFAAGEVASSASTEPSSATEPTKDNVISPVATKPSYTPEKKKVLRPDKCYNSPKTGDAFNETAVYSVIGFSALACGGAAVALAKTSKKK